MISAAIEARTACVCHKQAAVGQYHYISKRKKKEKILSQNRWKCSYENRIVAVVAIGVYKFAYINGKNLAWQKRSV